MNTLSRTGIMYSNLPTVETVDAAEYVFRYSVALSKDMLTWHVIAHDPHCLRYSDDDQEAMDFTNFDALVAGLSVEPVDISRNDPEDGPAIVEALETGAAIANGYLIVSPANVEDIERMQSMEKSLSNYPLLDEDAYSTLEGEAWAQYEPQAFRDEIWEANRDETITEDLSEFLTEHAEELLCELGQHLHYEDGFTGDYGPPFLTIFAELGGRAHFEAQWLREALAAAGQQTFPTS